MRLLALLLALLVSTAEARDRNVVREFRHSHPCPATGLTTGPCWGWEVDHVTPLCRGGVDTPENMQWLTEEQHKAKTRGDCRVLPGDRR